jgi:hypothetical protein
MTICSNQVGGRHRQQQQAWVHVGRLRQWWGVVLCLGHTRWRREPCWVSGVSCTQLP